MRMFSAFECLETESKEYRGNAVVSWIGIWMQVIDAVKSCLTLKV